jgi:hypothetical protein
MTLAPLGVLDLSIVTDRLLTLLKDARDHSALWLNPPGATKFDIEVTGSSPETMRSSGCTLSLYLFHVNASKSYRNGPVLPPLVPFQPLAIDLYYLLSSWSEKDYVQEQKAMSIALKCLHENPFVRRTVTIDGTPVNEEWTLTMEAETADEMGRLWQAITAPARLASVFRVSVVFLTPEAPPPPQPTPKVVELHVGLGDLVTTDVAQLFGTSRTIHYRSPITAGIPQPDIRSYDTAPAVAAPGVAFTIEGRGLSNAAVANVYLVDANGTEADVTTWDTGGAEDTSARRVIQLPNTAGAAPAATPPAGSYTVRLGSGTFRTNGVSLMIAAAVTPPAAGAEPFLTPAAGTYTLAGAGFIPGATDLIAGGTRLDEAALADGKFAIGGGGTSLQFRPPAGFADGTHAVRVRVNGVESPPAWWVKLP